MRRWEFDYCLMRFFVDGWRKWVVRRPEDYEGLKIGDEIDAVFRREAGKTRRMLRLRVTRIEELPDTEQRRIWFVKAEEKPRRYKPPKKEPRNPIIFISRDEWDQLPPEE